MLLADFNCICRLLLLVAACVFLEQAHTWTLLGRSYPLKQHGGIYLYHVYAAHHPCPQVGGTRTQLSTRFATGRAPCRLGRCPARLRFTKRMPHLFYLALHALGGTP